MNHVFPDKHSAQILDIYTHAYIQICIGWHFFVAIFHALLGFWGGSDLQSRRQGHKHTHTHTAFSSLVSLQFRLQFVTKHKLGQCYDLVSMDQAPFSTLYPTPPPPPSEPNDSQTVAAT